MKKPKLTEAEKTALRMVCKVYGKQWRFYLRVSGWENGIYHFNLERDGMVPVLQGLRNTRGPSWLSKVKKSDFYRDSEGKLISA